MASTPWRPQVLGPAVAVHRRVLASRQEQEGHDTVSLDADVLSRMTRWVAPLILLIVGLVGLVLDRQQVASPLAASLEGFMSPAGRGSCDPCKAPNAA
jgi:hypothetical protein